MMTATEIVRRLAQDFDLAAGLTVVGSGPVATEVAARLETPGAASRALIVVVSDEPDEIRLGFQTADDLGTVVLVCSDPPEFVDVDVYAELHARDLVVIGLA